jgi:hypothetical protein
MIELQKQEAAHVAELSRRKALGIAHFEKGDAVAAAIRNRRN